MTDIVICDTNVVIQLAIICPSILMTTNTRLSFIIHKMVKQEVRELKEKQRIRKILEFILTKVPINNQYQLPNEEEQEQDHRRIKRFEKFLSPQQCSAKSSSKDRCFLMLARIYNAKLLTNDETLYNLGKALLSNESTWRISDAIEQLKNGIVSEEEIQKGLNKLNQYKEYLPKECALKVKGLGFQYE